MIWLLSSRSWLMSRYNWPLSLSLSRMITCVSVVSWTWACVCTQCTKCLKCQVCAVVPHFRCNFRYVVMAKQSQQRKLSSKLQSGECICVFSCVYSVFDTIGGVWFVVPGRVWFWLTSSNFNWFIGLNYLFMQHFIYIYIYVCVPS